MRLLSLREVLAATGLARRTFFRLRERGQFPEPVRLSGCARHIAWIADEVAAWMRERGTVCRPIDI